MNERLVETIKNIVEIRDNIDSDFSKLKNILDGLAESFPLESSMVLEKNENKVEHNDIVNLKLKFGHCGICGRVVPMTSLKIPVEVSEYDKENHRPRYNVFNCCGRTWLWDVIDHPPYDYGPEIVE